MKTSFDSARSQQALASLRTPDVPKDSCSTFTEGNLAGTASTERGWLALEMPGSWGRDILDGTGVERETAKKISHRIKKETGFRFLLIRRPGRARTNHTARRVFIADSATAHPTLWIFTVSNPAELLSLPLDNPASIPGAQRWEDQVITLMCAHAKRDRCCALRGRPIAQYLTQLRPEETVWECSHISGHRYAPTGLILPSGYTYGRLSPASALAATLCLEEHAVPSLDGLRGRSSLGSSEQAAEVAVRRALLDTGEEPRIDELTFERGKHTKGKKPKKPDPTEILVHHADGRTWKVHLEKQKTAPVPASCGKGAKPVGSIEVLGVERI